MGLTQLQLAEDAFSDPTKVRRISDLENGLTSNPHPKTIDPILAVLEITPEQVEECAKKSGGKVDPDLDQAYREARNLIDALAYRFEHDHPDASLAELDHFLRGKATEWRQLRARLDAIDAATNEIALAKRDAAEALARGELDEVDATLASLEERYQEQHTLVEVGKQVEIRVTRGDACLMKDDTEGAFEHYRKAAHFYLAFSEADTARVLDETAGRVYEASQRMLHPRFGIGIRLLEELLKLDVVSKDRPRLAATHYRLSLLCRNAALPPFDAENGDLLERAIMHARLAANEFGEAGDAFQNVSAKGSLANCLMDLGKRESAPQSLTEAIGHLRTAKVIALEEEGARSLLPFVCNSLGSALLTESRGAKGVPTNEAIEEALEQYSEAVAYAEKFNNPEVWGVAKYNRAGLLAGRAREPQRAAQERAFLSLQAVSEYLAAIETYPETLFPERFANAHFDLATTLLHLALNVDDVRAEFFMFRAVQSFEIAGAIFTQARPRRWAECQMLSGSLIVQHATLSVAQDPQSDLEEAIRRFEAALPIYQREEDKEREKACKRAISGAKKQLAQVRSASGE